MTLKCLAWPDRYFSCPSIFFLLEIPVRCEGYRRNKKSQSAETPVDGSAQSIQVLLGISGPTHQNPPLDAHSHNEETLRIEGKRLRHFPQTMFSQIWHFELDDWCVMSLVKGSENFTPELAAEHVSCTETRTEVRVFDTFQSRKSVSQVKKLNNFL